MAYPKENQPVPDVEYFLISVAKKTPEKIIEICSGGDLANRVLFITAKENGVIRKQNGMYIYGEDGNFSEFFLKHKYMRKLKVFRYASREYLNGCVNLKTKKH